MDLNRWSRNLETMADLLVALSKDPDGSSSSFLKNHILSGLEALSVSIENSEGTELAGTLIDTISMAERLLAAVSNIGDEKVKAYLSFHASELLRQAGAECGGVDIESDSLDYTVAPLSNFPLMRFIAATEPEFRTAHQ